MMLIGIMLIICFVYVSYYTGHYFRGAIGRVTLGKMIKLFVGVMFVLICTCDFLWTLVFWEYLGVVRFFLILFYGSYLSLRSSVVTLVSSRFGDVCLFLLIACSYLLFNSAIFRCLLFFFIVFTKSAGFPFISWLLEAMRAPTPVRSLVHSSTLVAAGVWFVMRYNLLEYFDHIFLFSILLLITIFITGTCCFFFIDLKKIVALSTCKKISWCVLYLIFGDVCLSIFQLVSHGVAKCILFILVGDVMRGSGGSQASNCIYSPHFYGNWGVFRIFSVVLGLSGAPFIGVFFTKHFMLRRFNRIWKVPLLIFVMICVFLSYAYSFRLCSVIINTKISKSTGVLFFFNSWMIGYLWLFVGFFMSNSMVEHFVLSSKRSLTLLIFQVISCFIAYYAYKRIIFSNWRRRLFGCDNLVESSYWLMYSTVRDLNLFIYRWDKYRVYLFNKIGVGLIKVYKKNLLNFIIYSVIIFLTCFIIIY